MNPDPGALITNEGNASQIELRGYEVAEKQRGGWVQKTKHRPNKWGFEEACRALQRLYEDYPGSTYRIRPIVSFEPMPGIDRAADGAAVQAPAAPQEDNA